MTKKQLDKIIKTVSKAYGNDGVILSYYKDINGDHGDTLAKFIVQEIQDASKGGTIDSILSSMEIALKQISDVENALLD